MRRKVVEPLGKRNDMTNDCIERFIDYFPATLDIVTIRNRRLKVEISQSEIISLPAANGYNNLE